MIHTHFYNVSTTCIFAFGDGVCGLAAGCPSFAYIPWSIPSCPFSSNLISICFLSWETRVFLFIVSIVLLTTPAWRMAWCQLLAQKLTYISRHFDTTYHLSSCPRSIFSFVNFIPLFQGDICSTLWHVIALMRSWVSFSFTLPYLP